MAKSHNKQRRCSCYAYASVCFEIVSLPRWTVHSSMRSSFQSRAMPPITCLMSIEQTELLLTSLCYILNPERRAGKTDWLTHHGCPSRGQSTGRDGRKQSSSRCDRCRWKCCRKSATGHECRFKRCSRSRKQTYRFWVFSCSIKCKPWPVERRLRRSRQYQVDIKWHKQWQ